jgi:hypothetical protein
MRALSNGTRGDSVFREARSAIAHRQCASVRVGGNRTRFGIEAAFAFGFGATSAL